MKSNRTVSRGKVSRREFLGTAAATAAVSYFGHPSMALGKASAFAGVDGKSLPWKDQGVLNLTNSPYAKLQSVPVRAVTIEEGFWSKRRKTNVERSIPTMREAAWCSTAAWTTTCVWLARAKSRKRDPSTPTPTYINGPKLWDLPYSPATFRICATSPTA